MESKQEKNGPTKKECDMHTSELCEPCHKYFRIVEGKIVPIKKKHLTNLFIKLPIPIDESIPEGYSLILAYAKDDTVVIPINLENLSEKLHNCDWEGCTSISHVVRFNLSHKYETEEKLEMIELKNEERNSGKH